MQKLFLIGIIVLIHGCASQNGQPEQSGHLESIKARHEANMSKENQALPASFVECPNSFFWSTRNFSAESMEYSYTRAESAKYGPFKGGSGTVQVNNWPSENETKICLDISNKIDGGLSFMEYNVYQQFDEDAVFKLVQSDKDFHSISPKEARLENLSYYFDGNKKKIENYKLSIPVSITCENSWLAKQYNKYPFRVYFQQPKGKCHFSTKHYELELSPQQKVVIALNGSYEIDSEYPDKVTLVNIENFGFLPK